MKEKKLMLITAPAKVNLALDVITRRPDGYHQVDMVMQSIALSDQITLEPASRIELNCSLQDLPGDERNLAWRAARLLQEVTGSSNGVKIHIEKKIPIAAGLAGGSADAAAVLIGLNDMWKIGLSRTDLMEIGVRLGADVPFCIMQGTARARGIGEQLDRIESQINSRLLLVTPNIQVPTAVVYQKLQLNQKMAHPQITKVVGALETGNRFALFEGWGNLLEEVVLKEFPLVAQVKEYFNRLGLNHCLMSGSGPSVFALDPPDEVVTPFLAGLPSGWFGCLTQFLNP